MNGFLWGKKNLIPRSYGVITTKHGKKKLVIVTIPRISGVITPFVTGDGTHLVGNLVLQHQVDDAAGEVAALQVAVDVHAARGASAVSTICDVGCDVRIHIYCIII